MSAPSVPAPHAPGPSTPIDDPPPPRVAYLVARYPGPSLAFIEREVAEVRALGVEVHTFSVRPPAPGSLLTETMREEARRTPVLLADRAALVRDAARLLLRHPLSLLRAVARALRTGDVHPRDRVWQLFYLVEAVRLRAEMVHRGLRHVHVHFSNNAADVARHVVALGRLLDGPDVGWRWTMSLHGPTEFEAVDHFDLPAKIADAHAVACISDFARSQAMRLTGPQTWPHLRVVRMGVDVDHYRPTGRAAPRSGRPARILYVGRLVPEKGGTVLLEAVRLLLDRGLDVTVRMVGDGPMLDLVRAEVTRLGLADAVELLGARGQDELPDLYAWADVFCLPSFQEGLPVVLMEALASEVPVVTTRIAGIPELVDEHTGRLVSAGRADLLADALGEVLGDEELATCLGRNGRRAVLERHAGTVTGSAMAEFLRAAQERSAQGLTGSSRG